MIKRCGSVEGRGQMYEGMMQSGSSSIGQMPQEGQGHGGDLRHQSGYPKCSI